MQLYDQQSHIQALEKLCEQHEKHLTEMLGPPMTRNVRNNSTATDLFFLCLHSLLLLMRAIPYATSYQEMGNREAKRLCERARRREIDDFTWLREITDALLGFVNLWGPELTNTLVPAEMSGFLHHMVSNVTDKAMQTKILAFAEDFARTVAREQGTTVENMVNRLSPPHGYTGSQWKVPDFHGTAVGDSVVRLFPTSYELRKFVQLGTMVKFVEAVTATILGPLTFAAGVDANGRVLDSGILALDPMFEDPSALSMDEQPTSTAFAVQSLTSPAPTAMAPGIDSLRAEVLGVVDDRFSEMARNQQMFNNQVLDNFAQSTANITQQLSNMAQKQDLGKADSAHQAVASVGDGTPQPPPQRGRDRQPLEKRNVRWTPQHQRENVERQAGDGMRLKDKPPTKWCDIPEQMKVHLAAYGIHGEEDWLKLEETPCTMCGPNANHWWSRCVKIWATTPQARQRLQTARDSRRTYNVMCRTCEPGLGTMCLAVEAALRDETDANAAAHALIADVCDTMPGPVESPDPMTVYAIIDELVDFSDARPY